jgi:acetyltransferase-like isoleucine patch superfamily enzyme
MRSKGPTVLEDNVWLGANSVVTRDIPEFSVATGNPAEVLNNSLRTAAKSKEVT